MKKKDRKIKGKLKENFQKNSKENSRKKDILTRAKANLTRLKLKFPGKRTGKFQGKRTLF